MPDADPHAAEIVADMLDHAADAVVPRRAAAALHLDLHRREVEFVIKGGDVLRRELVEIQRRAHAAAAFVHEGRGLAQQHALAPDAAILNPALKLSGGHAESVNVGDARSEEHTCGLQSLLRLSYAVFCLNKINR